MCTVTFIPHPTGFHLTSNRDERPGRGQAIPPAEYPGGAGKLLFPRDADKTGTWIVAKSDGDLAVLLNGAFVKHVPQPSYRKSRGLILTDIISAEYPAGHYREMDLQGIEPFTLVLWTRAQLYECRWNGQDKHIVTLDIETPHIWCSATLYDGITMAKRQQRFLQWIQEQGTRNTSDILHFHHELVIDRAGMMKTVSITNVRVTAENMTMTYNDLKDGERYIHLLSIGATPSPKPLATPRPKTPPRILKTLRVKLKIAWIKLRNWEYWPFNVVYFPILFYWLWLCLKSRSFFFFSAANPSIENGGFANESKKLIYNLIPQKYYPLTLYFKAGTAIGPILSELRRHSINYPFITKPDIGRRGIQVKLVHDAMALSEYINQIGFDFLIQEFVARPNEIGIFYYRLPHEPNGHISGIVGKEFMTVTGDGTSTVEELMAREPRYLLQLPALRLTEPGMLKTVLAQGHSETVLPYGNHARGAKFIDLSHRITDELTQNIDSVCRQIPEFYFGRLDIRYNTWEELCRGENFSIIELNGAGSEPTHIYDPVHSIFFAWGEIIRHLTLLYRIGKANQLSRGVKYMGYREGIDILRKTPKYLKTAQSTCPGQ